ncbi:BsuPI-related putative proteinase inhibitor [Cohnella candidum]|uniref:Copper amine oxidase N-terminal domain-containing protein n=1 Tax=Cohnella candidum TaxID=2674991 RepID=A0A3G3JT06_9BACL|nr:BsuPI-related putative proteinase inhibitor [Cohnella candidum]AYQ71324.1 hypothetical protein EAV92_01195 [Cohnella candidum]
MKKRLVMMLAGGAVLGSVLTAGVGYASDFMQTIKINTKPVTITLNGETIVSGDKANTYQNGKENVPAAFQYRATTYVPLNLMAKTFGKDIAWNGSTRTISLTDPAPQPGIWAGRLEPSLTATSDGKYTYSVKNQTERALKFEFTSSQRYDFAIKNDKGETVYLYSSLATFAQVLGEENLKQGESLSYDINVGELGLEKGTYILEAWLTPKDGTTGDISVPFIVK